MIISANSSLRTPSISFELKFLLHFYLSQHFCPLTLPAITWEQQSHPQTPRGRTNSVWGLGTGTLLMGLAWAVPAQGTVRDRECLFHGFVFCGNVLSPSSSPSHQPHSPSGTGIEVFVHVPWEGRTRGVGRKGK